MDEVWLRATVAKGLAGLVVLRLPGQPPEDMITKTAEIWIKAILHQKIFNGGMSKRTNGESKKRF
ncbi:hypothetical protein [Pasteurella multocida]|uniref:hypothetical protein n=1 Tax=Pasteurella multocida TaxID=747 RepID=UPI0012D2F956|nr:hypothetical protein [Pasteurella multocida]